ncbi:FecR domain-containing protein [Janthinobacterium fluminis]|uniref:FecR domain-containing protein n=1 Tax=Janthinobacterium fluminis TaxID=2987524 RepID=A0ABT5JW63_9BURK|nr:FecR domain-containing protein [Janthinobacterium fluminis]MDC8756794.1 FecR domain-containing protein [Janthinobacterium fluminis]
MGAHADGGAIPPRIARRAVRWLVELQEDGAGGRSAEALQRWRASHPDHERAWQRIEAFNGRLLGLASPLGARVAHAALAPPRSPQRRAALKSLAVLLFAGGGAWLAQERAPWRVWLADERTAVGQRRTVVLADGSTVDMNTDSAISVRFSAGERRLRLLAGEVLVSTGKDGGRAARPFLLETAHGELQPLGTRFLVRQHGDFCALAVFEGAVAVRPRGRAALAYTLRAGSQLRFSADGAGAPAPLDAHAGAWVDGVLVASGMRLDDFLAELARHRPGRLRWDADVAGLRVSGSYPLADTDRILAALAATLPLQVRFISRYWVSVGRAA